MTESHKTKHTLVEQKLRAYSAESRISCGLARKIAEELDIPYQEVGRVANRIKIKIRNCELGCF